MGRETRIIHLTPEIAASVFDTRRFRFRLGVHEPTPEDVGVFLDVNMGLGQTPSAHNQCTYRRHSVGTALVLPLRPTVNIEIQAIDGPEVRLSFDIPKGWEIHTESVAPDSAE